ncbi:MAG: S1 RNA-binding domain-containing protein [Candidatus Bipolaricaulia bacterium]
MEFKVGDVVEGEVVGIKPYGAFIELSTGEIGMTHISEISSDYVRNIDDYVFIGQKIIVKILGTNEEGKYNLSIKQVDDEDRELAEIQGAREQIERSIREKHLLHEPQPTEAPVILEQLLAWIREAEIGLQMLKVHRASRLNEKFYGTSKTEGEGE